MFHALIDVGSNTVRLALYRIENGRAEMVLKKKNQLGLAAYLDDGMLNETGEKKLLETIADYRRFLADFRIEKASAFATAALRQAVNNAAVISRIKVETGVEIRILTGEDEATYDFIGAINGDAAASGVLIDVGGASTETVVFDCGAMIQKTSIPVGSLSLRKRFCTKTLPTKEEFAALSQAAEEIVAANLNWNVKPSDEIIAIGGTAKSAAALYREVCGSIETNAVGGKIMEISRLKKLAENFCDDGNLSENDLAMIFRAAPDRLHTLLPGLAAIFAICGRFAAQKLIYSDSGVREGYIISEILPNV